MCSVCIHSVISRLPPLTAPLKIEIQSVHVSGLSLHIYCTISVLSNSAALTLNSILVSSMMSDVVSDVESDVKQNVSSNLDGYCLFCGDCEKSHLNILI